MVSQKDVTAFQQTVWEYYNQHARHSLPWRQPQADGVFDPYKIMVSELMLQQTQVTRVISKYQEFLETFPTVNALASAEIGEVLRSWQGLGYNRRAKFLWQAAGIVQAEYNGVFPNTLEELVKLPGVGINTAGAIMAYAYNKPVVFLETNIRTIFIHHFFADVHTVSDKDLLPVVTAALPKDDSLTRDWYWALMDYGTYLKSSVGNLNKLSKTYTKQSAFHGSRRQVRGKVLRMLSEQSKTYDQLQEGIGDDRLESVLHDLMQEGLVRQSGHTYHL